MYLYIIRRPDFGNKKKTGHWEKAGFNIPHKYSFRYSVIEANGEEVI